MAFSYTMFAVSLVLSPRGKKMVFFLSGFLVYWWKVSDGGGESIKNCYDALVQSIIYYMLKL